MTIPTTGGHRAATTTVLVALATLTMAACAAPGSGSTAPATGGTARAAGPGATTGPTPAVPLTLPDVVGKGLQSAVDQVQAAGFTHFGTHDASGRLRAQILYRDWKVCFQSPAAGGRPPSVQVDLAVVKLAETCPAHDEGVVTATAGAVMPDLRGRSARYADEVLGPHASISFRTLTGGTAIVLVDSNWQVCSQAPAPGSPYGGVPATLTVAKYSDGGCPTG